MRLFLATLLLASCSSSAHQSDGGLSADSQSADTRSADIRPADARTADASLACGTAAPPSSAPPDKVTNIIYELPKLTGPYKVGTHVLHFIDKTRPETFGPTPNAFREVVVQLFYPTEAGGPPAPFASTAELKVCAGGIIGPKLARVATNSTFDVPLAKGSFPLVVYSHGFNMPRQDNWALVESIASHGAIVAALSHTYYDRCSMLSSGVITNGEGAKNILDIFKIHKVWIADIKFAVSQLRALVAPGSCTFLSGHLDSTKVATVGFSFGGSTAFQYCAGEPTCTGGINLDGMFFGTIDQTVTRPFMFVTQRRGEPTWEVIRAHAASATFTAWIGGTSHANFSIDPGLGQAIGYDGGGGPIDPTRADTLVRTYVQAFLDTVLFGKPTPSLLAEPSGVPSGAPEVIFERAQAGVVDGKPRILGSTFDPKTGPLSNVSAVVDGASQATDAAGTFAFDTTVGDSHQITTTASGHVPCKTQCAGVSRYRSVDLIMVSTSSFAAMGAPAKITPQPGKGHVLIVGDNCEAGLTATAGSLTTAYLDATLYVDPALTATASLGGAAIFNAPVGPLQVAFQHTTHGTIAPYLSPGTSPATVNVAADTVTVLYIACLPH